MPMYLSNLQFHIGNRYPQKVIRSLEIQAILFSICLFTACKAGSTQKIEHTSTPTSPRAPSPLPPPPPPPLPCQMTKEGASHHHYEVISLTNDLHLYIDHEEIPPDKLRETVLRLAQLRNRGMRRFILRVDNNVPFQKFMDVVDTINGISPELRKIDHKRFHDPETQENDIVVVPILAKYERRNDICGWPIYNFFIHKNGP